MARFFGCLLPALIVFGSVSSIAQEAVEEKNAENLSSSVDKVPETSEKTPITFGDKKGGIGLEALPENVDATTKNASETVPNEDASSFKHSPAEEPATEISKTVESEISASKNIDPSLSPPIWKVSLQERHAYIVGLVHLLHEREAWMSPELDEILNSANLLILETHMDAETLRETQETALKYGFFPPGESLKDHLDIGSVEKLQMLSHQLGADFDQIIKARPWMAMILLGQHLLVANGGDHTGSAERLLETQATKLALDITGLEKGTDQLDLFRKTNISEQLTLLKSSIDQMLDAPSRPSQLAQAWRDGDLKKLQMLSHDGLDEVPAFRDALLAKRNHIWAAQVRNRLQAGEKQMIVAISIANLVGEDNLIEQLSAMDEIAVEPVHHSSWARKE